MTSPIDPKTPVLVGAGAVMRRHDDPSEALEPLDLMAEAARRAADDCGTPALAARAGWVVVPKGMWEYPDPGRAVADAVGALGARTSLFEVGILQTTPFGEAAARIQAGDLDVAIIAGGEARYRALRARITGVEAPERSQATVPDEKRVPEADLVEPVELAQDFVWPVRQYAAIETALRSHRGQSVDEHLIALSELWARFSAAAARNPLAWRPEPMNGAQLRSSAGNRMISWPYAKLHNSQWNVDQAAAFIVCSAEAADAAGVPRDRWIFPRAVADSNFMTTVTSRAELHRSPGFRAAADAVASSTGVAPSEVDHLDLYSCFPVAVQVQAAEMGIDLDRELTFTGGMAFAGGPLNNYVFMAVAQAVHLLRDQGGTALTTAVSGFLTKQGVALWSASPGGPFRHHDVSAEARAQTSLLPVVDGHDGDATVAGYTVVYDEEEPAKLIAVCDTDDGARTVAGSVDPGLCDAAMATEFCATRVAVSGDGQLTPR